MTIKPYIAAALFLGCIPALMAQNTAQTAADEGHVSTTMTFVVKAPIEKASPLFTPTGMQCWLGHHFQPETIHAQPPNGTAGAVFTMQQGSQKSVWVNTLLDLKHGRMQYAMFVPDTMVTVVEVRMISDGKDATRIELTHTVTALSADARGIEVHGDTESGSYCRGAKRDGGLSRRQWKHALVNAAVVSRT